MRQLIAAFFLILSVSCFGQALLKPKGQGFEPLVQKSLEVEGRIDGGFASTKIQMVFANPARRRTEAEFVYTLPEGAVATGFAYWFGDEKVVARVVEKERAAEIYRAITTRQQDPALIELIGKRTFRARIFPVEPGADLRVEMTWVSFLQADASGLTYTVPLAAKERQPLSVDVRVQVATGEGLGAPTNNYGLELAGGKLVLQGDAMRPDKDLRLRMPVLRRPFVSVFSGRSGGPGGFFAMLVLGAKPSAPTGGRTSSVRIVAASGGAWHVTGRYAAPGTVTVSGRRVSLSGDAVPNHLGVKLWAAGEIERLGNRRADVTAISERHTLPSKFTSWLAIPSGERERFAEEIRTARARLLGLKYADQVARLGARSRAARQTWAQLTREAKALGMDPRAFQGDAWEVVERESERQGARFANLIRQGKDREARRVAESFERFARALTGEEYDLLSHPEVDAQLQRLAAEQLQVARSEGEGSPRARRLQARLQALAGREPASTIVQERVSSDVSRLRSRFDELFVKGEEGSDEARKVLSEIRWFGRQAGTEIGPIGDGTRSAVSLAVQLLVRRESGETVAQDEVAKARALLQRARSVAPSTMAALERESHNYAVWNLRYSLGREFALAVAKDGRTSPAAREIESRFNGLPKLQGETEVRHSLAESLQGAVQESFDRFVQDLGEGVDPKKAAAAYRQRLARLRSDDPKVRRLEEPTLKEAEESVERWSVETGFRALFHEQSRLFPKREAIEKARRLEAGLRALGYKPWDQRDTRNVWFGEWAIAFPELAARYRAGQFDDRLTRELEDKTWRERLAYRREPGWQRETIFERMKVNAMLDAAEAAPATPENQAKVEALRKQDRELRVRFGDPWIRVALPWTTVSAVATLPWGEQRTLVRVGTSRTWQARFDVPPTATPGGQRIWIEVRTSEGRAFTTWQSFTVDLTPPSVRVAWNGKRLEVLDLSGDVVRVKAVLGAGDPVALHRAAEGRWWADLPSAPVEVVALDAAHNLSRWRGGAALPPLPSPAGGAQRIAAEFRGNVQSLAGALGTVFAGTLDEGLWSRDARGAWQPVAGLPSGAPRDLTPFRGGLAVRFGDGELVWLTPAGTVRLDGALPRRRALAIAEHGGTLFVAQTGGWSEFDGAEWKHRFDVRELAGLPPSAISATGERLLFAAQGRGIATIDRASGRAVWTDERQGLTDDWVTVAREGLVGTFVGGALVAGPGGWTHLRDTADAHVTSVLADGPGAWWVGTRKGLFRVSGGRARKVADLEVQALARVGAELWVGTRDGAARVRIESP